MKSKFNLNAWNKANPDFFKEVKIKKAKQVWMDTDGDMDDLMSMTLLSAFSDVQVIGVTPHGIGASYLDGNLRWAVGMRKQLGFDYQVVAGKNAPVSYSNRYPYDATFFAEENFGLGYDEPKEKRDYLSNDKLIKTLKNIEGKFDLMIYGGATNWVEVIEKYPEIFEKVNYVYLYAGIINKDQHSKMGTIGNIKEAFNFQSPYDNDVAEWNVFVDTVAMKKIIDFFKSKVLFFPINLSNNLDFNTDFRAKLEKINTKRAKIWVDIIDYLDKKNALEYIRIWSQVATIFYLLPQDKLLENVNVEIHDIDVVIDYKVKDDQNGKIILDSGNGNKTNVVMWMNEKIIYKSILEMLQNEQN